MEKKKVVKKPKFEIQVKKMVKDWWEKEGSQSIRRFVQKNFDKYFEVK